MRTERPEKDFRPAPITLLRRKDFLKLIDMSDGNLTSDTKRGHLPLLPGAVEDPDFVIAEVRPPGPNEERPGWDAKGWTPDIAFAYAVQRAFVEDHQMRVERACKIAGFALKVGPVWPRVRALANLQINNIPADQVDGNTADVMIASILRRDITRGIGIGSLDELAKLEPTAIAIVAVSLVSAAVQVRTRAIKHSVDIDGWWNREVGK